MTKLTDRQLANFAYSAMGIKQAKWQAHWLIDTTRSTLSKAARAAYTAIYMSVYKPV